MAERATRVLDYVFGRNTLIGIAALMLLLISGYATWHGMSDFILGFQASGTEQRAIGGLSVTTEALIVAITVALTFLMWLALRETFGSRRPFGARLVTFPLYLFLALWSVGFGYGFWWSLIAGPTATQESLQNQAEDARDAAFAVRARLDAVRGRLDAVVSLSERRMAQEESQGGSCGVASGTGRGPLYRARLAVRDGVAALQDSIARDWLGAIDADLAALEAQVTEISTTLSGETPEEREAQFRAAAAEIRGRAARIATRSDALGASAADGMRQLSTELSVEPGQDGFTCYDPQLAAALSDAAQQAASPADVSLPDAAFTEGAAGVAAAVLNLWENLGAYFAAIGDWWSAPADMSETEAVAETESGDPITGRDLIALLAALGVDLGLFALMVLNPPTAPPARRDSLDDTLQRLNEPSQVSIDEIAGILRTALLVAPDTTSLEWVRKHFFSHLGHSYFVIPNMADCPSEGDTGNRALAINQLAGVLSKIKLVQALDRPRRLYGRQVRRGLSDSDLESRWREAMDAASIQVGKDEEANFVYTKSLWYTAWVVTTTQHRKWRDDFIEKARKTLAIAGWEESERARPEIYVVYHREGLEPILTVLERGEPEDVHTESGAKS